MKHIPFARIFLLIACWFGSLLVARKCWAETTAVTKPANYAEIKALLDSYASAIDSYGEPQDGRTALLAKGDEATDALIELLKEKIAVRSFSQEKSAIVSLLVRNKATDKKRSAKLLAGALPEKVEEWEEQWWIVGTIRFLVQVDPQTALTVARKAMKASISTVTFAAMKALGTLGNLEDIQVLESFRVNWRADAEKRGHSPYKEYDNVDDEVVQAEAEIYKRVAPR